VCRGPSQRPLVLTARGASEAVARRSSLAPAQTGSGRAGDANAARAISNFFDLFVAGRAGRLTTAPHVELQRPSVADFCHRAPAPSRNCPTQIESARRREEGARLLPVDQPRHAPFDDAPGPWRRTAWPTWGTSPKDRDCARGHRSLGFIPANVSNADRVDRMGQAHVEASASAPAMLWPEE